MNVHYVKVDEQNYHIHEVNDTPNQVEPLAKVVILESDKLLQGRGLEHVHLLTFSTKVEEVDVSTFLFSCHNSRVWTDGLSRMITHRWQDVDLVLEFYHLAGILVRCFIVHGGKLFFREHNTVVMHDQEHILIVGSQTFLIVNMSSWPALALDFVDEDLGLQKLHYFNFSVNQLMEVV